MRLRDVAVFFIGFAVGVVFLAMLVWQTHGMRTIKASGMAAPQVVGTAPPELAPENKRSLLIPVQGVSAAELHNDFEQMHSGHRHEALDILAPRGTPVLATDAGKVVKLFLSKPGGLTVYQFDDSRTWCYYYAHLDHYEKGLQEGTLLRRGDVLGYVGVTGNAPPNAPHLHFAIFKLGPDKHWWQGSAVNPYPLLSGQPR